MAMGLMCRCEESDTSETSGFSQQRQLLSVYDLTPFFPPHGSSVIWWDCITLGQTSGISCLLPCPSRLCAGFSCSALALMGAVPGVSCSRSILPLVD